MKTYYFLDAAGYGDILVFPLRKKQQKYSIYLFADNLIVKSRFVDKPDNTLFLNKNKEVQRIYADSFEEAVSFAKLLLV